VPKGSIDYNISWQGNAKNWLAEPYTRVFRDASLGVFLFAPACPIEKVAVWASLHYFMLQSEMKFHPNWKLIERRIGGPRPTTIFT